MNKRLFLTLFGMMFCLIGWSITEPEEGKFYRIASQNPDKSVNTEGVRRGFVIEENTTNHKLICTEPGADNKYEQIWKYVSGKFMNAKSQQHIASNSARSTQFQTTKSGNPVTLDLKNNKYYLLTCGMQIHADGSNNIVAWNDENNVSNQWNFEEVEVDEEEMALVQAAYAKEQQEKAALEAIAAKANTYAPIVQGYFEDAICTTLKSQYATMTDAALKSDMATKGLPTQLQDMVINIKNKWASEFDKSMSEMFRVQEFKCYSKSSYKNDWVSTQLADLNNPTGIWTNTLQLMYIFVENEVPEGTSLRIASTNGSEITFANWDGGKPLHQGLNIVYCDADYAYQWIMYVANTTDYSTPISSYPKMKIHIEGGEVLGYADIAGKSETEANALYEKTLKNALALLRARKVSETKINFAVKGERGLMLYPVDCYNQIWGEKRINNHYEAGFRIYKSMYFYDQVLKWEWSAMGWQDCVEAGEFATPAYGSINLAAGYGDAAYPTFVNNLAPTMMLYKGKNPYSSDRYTCMPSVGAVESSYNAERPDFDTWCVGHESGHNNQHTINLPSSMESSNNYFSNVITYLWGYRMSRGNTFTDNMAYYNSQTIFPLRDISITLRMYYNLFLYYHRAQNNMGFTQKLHKLLRADRMSFGGNGSYNDGINGNAGRGSARTSWLKFYEKACDAAGEDLTEYFRLWGFFIPCQDAYCGDYSSYYITATQEDIDAAIARVKAKGYPVNKQIMFVEDRLQLQPRTDIWASSATGESNGVSKQYKPDNTGTWRTEAQLKATYGDLGFVDHFNPAIAESKGYKASADYSFVVNGNNITLTGNGGGVGILIYNEEGDIIYASNALKFNIPTKVGLQNYTIKVINADGSEVVATDATPGGKESQLTSILQTAINETNSITNLVDETGTKVGYYLPSALTHLYELIAQANEAIASKNASQYASIYNALSQEVENVKKNGAKVQIEENSLYTIRNNSRNRYLTDAASTSATANNDNAKWAFIKDGNAYYMQNAGSLKLINGIYDVSASTLAAAADVKLIAAGNGCWYLKTPNSENKDQCLNNTPSGEKVIGWSEDAGSQWYITKVAEVEPVTRPEIVALINSTNSLIALAGTIENGIVNKTSLLQCTNSAEPYYVKTNKANEAFPIANLIDGNNATDFRTKDEPSSSTPHNIVIDLGEGNEVKQIRLTITTPNNGKAPKTMVATPGTSSTSFKAAQATTWNDLPTGDPTQLAKAFDTKETDQPYRFWRFQVTAVHGSDAPTFGLARIQLRTMSVTFTPNPGFEGLDKAPVVAASNAQKDANNKIAILSTPLSNKKVYDDLKAAYDALYAAMEAVNPTSIGVIGEATINYGEGIFDLNGRKLETITKSGVYVVNGKKVMVK